MSPVILRTREGDARHLAVDDWHEPATDGERAVLAGLRGPVLDLGCGPGRLVVALGQLGTAALGVDASPAAVATARGNGANVLHRSVFDRIPGEGRWHTVLLFDGNVGIGGDPVALLARVAALLAGSGQAVVEVGPPGSGTRATEARLEHEDGYTPWFPWAWVSADDIGVLALGAGLRVGARLTLGDRWFAVLVRS